MGCICCKGFRSNDRSKDSRQKTLAKSTGQLPGALRREEIIVTESASSIGNNGIITRLIQQNQENPQPFVNEGEKQIVATEKPKKIIVHQRRVTVDFGGNDVDKSQMMTPVPRGLERELVAAGWPDWLVSVAGEAVRGWVPRNPASYEKLEQIGQGTYSNVFKARDLVTDKIVALKKVRFVNTDPESVKFMAREILILRRLDHPNIIKLENIATSSVSGSFYLAFEYMEHDFAGLLSSPGIKLTEPQIKCYMKQLLSGLEHCHSRGVLHRDIKGSNLLLDDNGILKIADFGLATLFNPSKEQPLTSRVVTLWYRPPELLLGTNVYGTGVDLWSAGCILGELLAGKPILPGGTEVEQLHRIFKLCGSPSEEYWQQFKWPHATMFKSKHNYRRCISETFRDFPPAAISLLNVLLAFEPDYRGTATSALNSDFFMTRPLACDPSSLPKYPPSKEYDAKRQGEEERSPRVAEGKDGKQEASRALPPAIENPDPVSRRDPLRRKSRHNHTGSGQLFFNGGPPPSLATVNKFTSMAKQVNASEEPIARQPLIVNPPEIPNFTGLADARGVAKSDNRRERTKNLPWPEHNESEKPEWPSISYQKKEEKDRQTSVAYGGSRSRLHFSGPLMPSGGNIEEMLKEHERRVQQATRKAKLDRAKTKKGLGEKGQLESLIHGRGESSGG